MFAAVNNFLKIIPPIVFAVVILILGLGTLGLFSSLNSANQELGASRTALQVCRQVNEKNSRVVDLLQVNTDACIAGREADEKVFEDVKVDWIKERGALRLKALEVRVEEIEIYRDPSCAEFAQLDIGSMCPALVDKLRDRAGDRNSIRDSGSEGTSEDSGT